MSPCVQCRMKMRILLEEWSYAHLKGSLLMLRVGKSMLINHSIQYIMTLITDLANYFLFCQLGQGHTDDDNRDSYQTGTRFEQPPHRHGWHETRRFPRNEIPRRQVRNMKKFTISLSRIKYSYGSLGVLQHSSRWEWFPWTGVSFSVWVSDVLRRDDCNQNNGKLKFYLFTVLLSGYVYWTAWRPVRVCHVAVPT